MWYPLIRWFNWSFHSLSLLTRVFAYSRYHRQRWKFFTPRDPGFKIWLWFWWWMCFSKSQIVAVLKCMIYISQPSWYFFTHFSWKIPGYLSPLSELLTPLDSAVLPGTKLHTAPHQSRIENDFWNKTLDLTALLSLLAARSAQSENNWHGKMPPATGSC